jgi:hypothetical protein
MFCIESKTWLSELVVELISKVTLARGADLHNNVPMRQVLAIKLCTA